MIYCLAHIRTQQKIIVTFVIFMAMRACLVAFQLCLILCDPMDCSPPGFLFMSFSRQEYWSGFTCPSPGDHPDPGIKPASYITFTSPALAGRFFTTSHPSTRFYGHRYWNPDDLPKYYTLAIFLGVSSHSVPSLGIWTFGSVIQYLKASYL